MNVQLFTQFTDIVGRIDVPANGTFSLTLHQDEHVKVVLAGFTAGQDRSEHTASAPAVRGEG